MRIAFGVVAGLALGAATQAVPAGLTPERAESPGERAYRKCLSCHSLEPNGGGLSGPGLGGIPGGQVAARPDFAYSPALLAYARRQPKWTREALDAFLADPQGVVPSNEMGFFGMRDPSERAALIDWLERRRPAD